LSEQTYTNLNAADVVVNEQSAFAEHVLIGLSEKPRRLSSRYFYDARGSALFEEIMHLPEYYPTRTEAEILGEHAASMFARLDAPSINLVDLGAGNAEKTAIILDALLGLGITVRYVPIDISEAAIRGCIAGVGARFPSLQIQGLVGEYGVGLNWLANHTDRPTVALFLGSNIGNFDAPRAKGFLRRLWSGLNAGDHVLIGFDLKKEIDILLDAYNDKSGVTASFNLNLLHRINDELGGHFPIDSWRHFSTYNVISGAMESFLVAMESHSVRIDELDLTFDFRAWEAIHTEFSYKYLDSDISHLAAATHFRIVRTDKDDKGWFAASLWQVEKA
jgi:L-histidine N-alpha-methyltransferase